MIIDLPSTTTSEINEHLVELRSFGGLAALGRVLTLVVVTEDDHDLETAIDPVIDPVIDAANEASKEHPSRILVAVRGTLEAEARLDAEIRTGADAGASEVIVFRLYGELAKHADTAIVPLLLPDSPIVTWWPQHGPDAPAQDPLGTLAQRRITDSAAAHQPLHTLRERARGYIPGDTDLAWARLTHWRAQLVAALDLPPHEPVTAARVTGEAGSPSLELLAGWLAEYLRVPVARVAAGPAEGAPGGIVSVRFERASGPIELHRPDGRVGTLTQPGQPPRTVALPRRAVHDALTEELRRLDPDEVYEAALAGLSEVEDDVGAREREDAK